MTFFDLPSNQRIKLYVSGLLARKPISVDKLNLSRVADTTNTSLDEVRKELLILGNEYNCIAQAHVAVDRSYFYENRAMTKEAWAEINKQDA